MLAKSKKRQFCHHLTLAWKLFPNPVEDEEEEEADEEEEAEVATNQDLDQVVGGGAQVDEMAPKQSK